MAALIPVYSSDQENKKDSKVGERSNGFPVDPFVSHFLHLPRLPFRGFEPSPHLSFLDRRVMHDLYGYLFAQHCNDLERVTRLPVESSNHKIESEGQRMKSHNPEMSCGPQQPIFKPYFPLLRFPQERSYQQVHVDSKITDFHRAVGHQQNFMSFLYSQAANRAAVQKPFLELEGKILWRQFHNFGTEMVITKNGRRMFPLPSFRVFGLDLEENYIILMDIVPVDQFRYKFQGASWTIAGRADPEPPQKAFVHPDSPCSGSLWMAKPVSFNRLKLTNHTAEKQGYLVLNSMQKYQPRVHIIKASQTNQGHSPLSTFVFEEMEFMAVTAYQNEKVTQLKIENNPFAKGFRISSETKTSKKRPLGSSKQKSSLKRWSFRDGDETNFAPSHIRNKEIEKKNNYKSESSSDSEIDVG